MELTNSITVADGPRLADGALLIAGPYEYESKTIVGTLKDTTNMDTDKLLARIKYLEHENRRYKAQAKNWLSMQFIAPIDYQVYNNCAVVVTFNDGTKTKSVCHKEDKFDLEVGIAICILKKYMGGSSETNKTIKKLIKLHQKRELEREKTEMNAKRMKEKVIKNQKRRAAARIRREIEIQKEAILEALKELQKGE